MLGCFVVVVRGTWFFNKMRVCWGVVRLFGDVFVDGGVVIKENDDFYDGGGDEYLRVYV